MNFFINSNIIILDFLYHLLVSCSLVKVDENLYIMDYICKFTLRGKVCMKH